MRGLTGLFVKAPSALPERFPAASEVTKQTTNDNITKTNLFFLVLLFPDAKVRQKVETGIMLRFRSFFYCIKV
ncbi:MAG: hypothetical protein II822_06625 [Prevotella sp.]|nr:hypothetical protein [Prevotella sp.]